MNNVTTQDIFDLDITTVASAPRAADLLEATSDGCGHTPDSAGVACFI